MNFQARKARQKVKEYYKEEKIRQAAGLEDAEVVSVNYGRGVVQKVFRSIFNFVYDLVALFYAYCGLMAVVFFREKIFDVIKTLDTKVVIVAVLLLVLYVFKVILLIKKEKRRALKKNIITVNKEENVVKVSKNTFFKQFVDSTGFVLSIILWLPIYILAYIGIIALIYTSGDLFKIFADGASQISGMLSGEQKLK